MNLGLIRTFRAPHIGNMAITSGSSADVALNSAFVNGTSGACFAVRYTAFEASPIDEFYIFLGAVSGTLGNITMECKIFNENSSQATRAGSTLRATSSTTVMPDAAGKWIKFAFASPYTPVVGEVLWIAAYNTAANPATDYPRIRTALAALVPEYASTYTHTTPYTTANGFTSNGTNQIRAPFVICQNGAPVAAQPFTARANCFSNNQLERGIRFTPKLDCVVFGVLYESPTAALVNFRLLADETAPGGSALVTRAWVDTNRTNDVMAALMFDTPITLSKGVTYRATSTYTGSNTTNPGSQHKIEDYSSYSAMFDTILDKDRHSYPIMIVDNGAGGWTEFTDHSGGFVLMIDDFPEATGGGRFGGINNSFVRRAN